MRTIAISCQKGGVGKTTTAVNLGAGLAMSGKKVLFIDLDAQGNMTDTLQAAADVSSFDIIKGATKDATKLIQHTAHGDVIPASLELVGADILAMENPEVSINLSNALRKIQGQYDYCVIDTPPALGVLTMSALFAADDVVVTVQADPFSLRAIGQLSMTVDMVKQGNRNLQVVGILLTRHSSRAILSRDMAEMIGQASSALNTTLFDTTIREAVAIKESQAMKQTIFQYAPKSLVAHEYMELVKEYQKRTKQHQKG